MVKIYIVFTVILACIMTGCSAGGKVLSLGPDTYTVSNQVAPVAGGSVTAKERSLQDAADFSKNIGKQVFVTNLIESSNQIDYSVTFKCLREGDPELERPTYEASPDVVVRVE